MALGGLIAHQRLEIARLRDPISICGHVATSFSTLFTLLPAAIAKLARQAMHLGIATLGEVAVAGGLIGLGRCLITVGRRLIACRRSLIAVGRRLIACRRGLIGVRCRPVSVRAGLILIGREV